MILGALVIGLVWAAEFSVKRATAREKFMNDLVMQMAVEPRMVSSDELQEAMTRMVKADSWDPIEGRWLGLKALDFYLISTVKEVQSFFNHSCKIVGPVLIGDLVRFVDSLDLMSWEPVLVDYFQKYRLRHIENVTKELKDAVEAAPTTCLKGGMALLLSNLLLPEGSGYRMDNPYPIGDYHSAKISCLFHVSHFPKMGIYRIIFGDYIGLVEHLEVLNEIDVKYNIQLDNWMQNQSETIQKLLRAIRGELDTQLMHDLMPTALLDAFRQVRTIKADIHDFSFSLLAFAFRRWPHQFIFQNYPLITCPSTTNLVWRAPHMRMFQRTTPILFTALSSLFWTYPELLGDRPEMIQYLPDKMPPIRLLIPKNVECTVVYAPLFGQLAERYGFEVIEQAMREEGYSNDMIFYLYMSNGVNRFPNGLKLPECLTEMERIEWLLHAVSMLKL